MRHNHINKIAIMLLAFQIISITDANALTEKSKSTQDYNFFTVKAGLAQPTNLGNVAGLSNGSTAYNIGAVLGRKFMDIFSVDGEFISRGNSNANSASNQTQSSSWSTKSNTFTINASVDLVQESVIRPYFRAGAGFSVNRSSDYNITLINKGVSYDSFYTGKSINSFAWQAGFGANFKYTALFDTQIEYMFVDRGKVTTKSNYTDSAGSVITKAPISGRLKDHVITIGLKIKI